LTNVGKSPTHLPNPSYVEEDEFVDEEFQEDEFVDKKFYHEDVEDPSQCSVDWDSLPTYDTEINDEDLVVSSLSYDQVDEFVVDWASPLIYSIHPEEEDWLNKVSLLDNTENFVDESTILHMFNRNPKIEEFDVGTEEISFVDFLGVAIFY
jgi:hypothetical protein